MKLLEFLKETLPQNASEEEINIVLNEPPSIDKSNRILKLLDLSIKNIEPSETTIILKSEMGKANS